MDDTIRTLLTCATRAPSGHNAQPWRFSVGDGMVRIHPDFSRRLPVVDPDDHALYISLGCALENLVVAAAQHGLAACVDYFPADELEECLRVRLSTNGHGAVDALYSAIPLRQSNRRRYDGRRIAASDACKLLEAGLCGGVTLRAFRTGEPDVEPLIGFVREGNRIQFNDPSFVDELVSWIRFSRAEASARQDGLTAAALGFPAIPRWLGKLVMTRLVGPDGEARRQEQAIRSSSLLLLFIAGGNDKRHWVDVGRSFERVALTATSLGIAHAHVNMPCEVEAVRRRLAAHLGLTQAQQPLLLIRFGYAKNLPPAPRRPLEQVIENR